MENLNSFNFSDIFNPYGKYVDNTESTRDFSLSIINVVTIVIICIGLPLTLVAIYGFYSLVRNDQFVSIYIINLLISDLIQFCCMIISVAKPGKIHFYILAFAVMVSICFMVCISMERYLVVAWPVWYHLRRNIKTSVMVCVVVWILPLVFLLPICIWVDNWIAEIVIGVLLLLPLPLFIFFLVGTCKALSASRVPSDEKRRIVAILVVVLLIYTLLFLPRIIYSLAIETHCNYTFTTLTFIFVNLSPLADLFLYFFIKKGAADQLLSSLCCCCLDGNEISTPNNINGANIYTIEREMQSVSTVNNK